ncbi:MAG: hypothetical protein ACI8T1_001435 [Verrucomicrobiales bacterium]|jgi:hypothetical protein
MKSIHTFVAVGLVSTSFLAPGAFAKMELLFAEDLRSAAGNAVPRLKAYPKSQTAWESFKQRLGGVDAVNFENLKSIRDHSLALR